MHTRARTHTRTHGRGGRPGAAGGQAAAAPPPGALRAECSARAEPRAGAGGTEGETLTWGHRGQLGAGTTRSRAGFPPSATPTLGLILLRCGAAVRTAGCLATSPRSAGSSPRTHDCDNEERVQVLVTPPGGSHRAEGGLFWDGSVTGGGRGAH